MSSASSKTYILIPDVKVTSPSDPQGVDLVTEVWEASRKWAVGYRQRSTGTITFNNREFFTLQEVCDHFELRKSDVMKRVVATTPEPVTGS